MLTKRSIAAAKTTLLFVAVLLFCTPLAGCRHEETVTTRDDGPKKLMLQGAGAYTGAYVDFGEGEDDVTFDALTAFEQMTGKHLAIVAFGSFWGEQSFPVKTV